jgi:hypothetical protein
MFFRFFFDYAAALQFLLKGHPKNTFSVVKARWDFQRQKKNYRTIRTENLKKTIKDDFPPEVFRKSLLWEYYVKGKKNV